MAAPKAISQAKFERTLRNAAPDHENTEGGYALVGVMPRDEFEKAHIPRSMNIPVGELDRLQERFAKTKPILLYCASTTSDQSPPPARRLAEMGFENVFEFEEGMAGWKRAGHGVASGPAAA